MGTLRSGRVKSDGIVSLKETAENKNRGKENEPQRTGYEVSLILRGEKGGLEIGTMEIKQYTMLPKNEALWHPGILWEEDLET